MDPALTGLIGALTGGLIASGSNWGLEAARNRRAERVNIEGRGRELREAARMIDDELVASIATLHQTESRRVWASPNDPLPTERWRDYGPVIARSEVGEDAWTWLADAYQAIREANGSVSGPTQRGGVSLEHDDVQYLSGVKAALEEAVEHLRADLRGRGPSPF
jgi:hypothetical protein